MTANYPDPAEALYAPLLIAPPAGRPLVFAHLGQSLDGRIATRSGSSQWITGPEDIAHCHRLRAIADAVMVGASTVALDDPRLTVRAVSGEDPLRVVIDPRCGLPEDRAVFTGARSTVLCGEGARYPHRAGGARLIELPLDAEGKIAPDAALACLAALGVRRLFIEGGGVTVSRFLQAGCVDRLHLAIAPVILGSGRQGIQLDEIASIHEGLRPITRTWSMGADVLFDCHFERSN